jgi:hypothetical protein
VISGYPWNFSYGSFVPDDPKESSFTYSGPLFRCVPSTAYEALSASYSVLHGNRWNTTDGPVTLYTFTALSSARSFEVAQSVFYGRPLEDRPPEELPDLVIFNASLSVTNVATSAGLASFNLPVTYPVGFQTPDCYTTTQPIGQRIFEAGALGLVTRSATLTRWDGPMVDWAEIAIFTERFQDFALVARYPWEAWFGGN